MKDLRDPGTKGLDHRTLPTGEIISNPVKGDFQALPLFGWMGKRDRVDTPLVMLVVLLMRSTEDPIPRGTLRIEHPVFPETELAILAELERFGWDGRVWPVDEGWPTGAEVDEGNILTLMEQAAVRATLTFPPNGNQGVPVQPVTVTRSRGPFLMPALRAPEGEPDPVKLIRFRQLCENPRVFFQPVKPAEILS